MNINILLMICSLFYIGLLLVDISIKKRNDSTENKLFVALVVSSFIGLILDISSIIVIPMMDKVPFLAYLVTRGFLLYLLTWVTLFTLYTLYITVTSKSNLKQVPLVYKGFKTGLIITYVISFILILVLPLNYYYQGDIMYSFGPSASVIYIVSTLYVFIASGFVLVNFKNIKHLKYTPIIFYITVGSLLMLLQLFNPELLIASSMEAFIIYLMYFTIENPDFKLLQELNFQREQAETSKYATNKVIDQMASNLQKPLETLKGFGHKKINYNNIEELKNEIKEFQEFALQFTSDVDSLLNLGHIQSEGFEVDNKDYEPVQLINEIIEMLKLKNKKINVSVKDDGKYPPVLYGDSIKIRQMLIYLYQGILKVSSINDIDFEVSDLSVGNLCRLKFNLIFDKDKADKDYLESDNKLLYVLDFEIVSRLVKLFNGKFNVNTNSDKVIFSLVVDQHIEGEYEKETTDNLSIEEMPEVFDAKRKKVLIIDDDKERINKLTKILTLYNIEVKSAKTTLEVMDKLNNEDKFELVIVDDIIQDIEEVKSYLMISTTNKLARLMDHISYEVPKVMMVTPNKKDYEKMYLEEGFDDTITKPINEKNIHDILIKYLKK